MRIPDQLNPLVIAKWFRQFIYAWFITLPIADLPRTVPAIILMIVLGLASAIVFSSESIWRTTLLNNQLTNALDRDDFETAELILVRQLSDRPDDARTAFSLGRVRKELGKDEGALDQMRRLVAVKRHGEAARWILQEEYAEKAWSNLTQVEKDELERLLALLADEYPNDQGILELYANLLLTVGKQQQALEVLSELARYNPMRGLQAAALLRKEGDHNLSKRFSDQTLARVETLLEEDPTNSRYALAVAQTLLFQKKHVKAIRVLEDAIKRNASKIARAPEADRKRFQIELKNTQQAFGDAVVAYVESFDEDGSKPSSDQNVVNLKMLSLALQQAPNNPRVLTVVSNKVLALANDDNDELTAVREALINSSSAGVAHFIRGTAALMKGDNEAAERSLQIASEHMPSAPAVLNNLAVSMVMSEKADLGQALSLAEKAIQQSRQPPAHFYETRGQILFRMERYEDAIPDLERALMAESLAANAHRDLAECYRQIGDDEMRLLHEQAADDLKAKAAEQEKQG